MDSGAFCRSIPAVETLPFAAKAEGRPRASIKIPTLNFSDPSVDSKQVVKGHRNQNFGGRVSRGGRLRSSTFVTFASADSRKGDFRSVAIPLEPQSSAGKFLSSVLKNQHHIFHVAAAEQLEELTTDRDGAVARQKNSLGSTEHCLHRRIAEMKEQECQFAVEEVMYMLIGYKFSEIGVPMVPRLSKCIKGGRLEIWASKDRELEGVHSLDVLEMIQEHLSTILGWRGKSDATDNWTASLIPRLQLGRVYAASIMYGYFLKSACLRHHLELNLALSYRDLPLGHGICAMQPEFQPHGSGKVAVLGCCPMDRISSYQGMGRSRKTEKLRDYVIGFDAESLQRCAKLKSQEAVNLIEKHSWALFGYDDAGHKTEDDEVVTVTFSSFKRLVLEAVAFGSFLWDVERYVDSIYRLKEN